MDMDKDHPMNRPSDRQPQVGDSRMEAEQADRLDAIRMEAEQADKRDPSFAEGIRDCVPTLLGYVGIGFAAGIVGSSASLSVAEVGLMSALVYAGAAQFIMCAMLMSLSPATAIVLTTFVVNLRHLLMSAAIAPHFTRYSLSRNFGFGALLTDETFGVAVNRIHRNLPVSDRWMNGVNLTAYSTWIASCMVGAWLGNWIADPTRWGLDFALTGMFAALLVLHLLELKDEQQKHQLMLVGCMIVLMVLFSMFLSGYMAVLISTMIVATIGAVTGK